MLPSFLLCISLSLPLALQFFFCFLHLFHFPIFFPLPSLFVLHLWFRWSPFLFLASFNFSCALDSFEYVCLLHSVDFAWFVHSFSIPFALLFFCLVRLWMACEWQFNKHHSQCGNTTSIPDYKLQNNRSTGNASHNHHHHHHGKCYYKLVSARLPILNQRKRRGRERGAVGKKAGMFNLQLLHFGWLDSFCHNFSWFWTHTNQAH